MKNEQVLRDIENVRHAFRIVFYEVKRTSRCDMKIEFPPTQELNFEGCTGTQNGPKRRQVALGVRHGGACGAQFERKAVQVEHKCVQLAPSCAQEAPNCACSAAWGAPVRPTGAQVSLTGHK